MVQWTLNGSLCILRVEHCNSKLRLNFFYCLENSVVPDEMLQYAAFHLVLHCLSKDPFKGGASFVDHFCYLWLSYVLVFSSCLLIVALWSPAGKGLTSWLSCGWCFIVFCYFPMRCYGSGMEFDCIDSWSLSSFLLTSIQSVYFLTVPSVGRQCVIVVFLDHTH